MPEPIISCTNLTRTFRMGDSEVHVLQGVDFAARAGEFIAIEGRSGSGKSTMLHVLGTLDEPNGGDVRFAGNNLFGLQSAERSRIRNESFGFVFQFYHLLPELNVLENAMLGSMIRYRWFEYGSKKKELRERGEQVLDSLGLAHRLRHRPSQLSGGERQRVAIARALMNEPQVLFADEPTGNLDSETGGQIMRVLEGLHERGQTIIMVTHDRTIAKRADRALILKDGKLTNA